MSPNYSNRFALIRNQDLFLFFRRTSTEIRKVLKECQPLFPRPSLYDEERGTRELGMNSLVNISKVKLSVDWE